MGLALRVVHGKGLGSPGKVPVLKHRHNHWCRNEVLVFVQARAGRLRAVGADRAAGSG